MTGNNPSILITGANGFVGSRLCRTFHEQGFAVIAGVRRQANLSLLDGLKIDYRYGDVTAPETLDAMVTGVDYVIHNAGVVKAKRAQTFFDINERGTRSLCEAVRKHNPGLKKLIYISSLAAVGPSAPGKPVTESCTPHPVTTYGRSKLAGERAALTYADRLPVVAIRPPGIYGPGDREVFTFFDTVNKGLRSVVGDPDRMIQLVHVDDLCYGVYKAVTGDSAPGEAYFVAENRGYTMGELVGLLAEASGKKTMPLRVPGWLFRVIGFVSEYAFKLVGATPMLTREKAGELLASWEVSTEKAKAAFGYESRIPFARGAADTFAWYRREGWLK